VDIFKLVKPNEAENETKEIYQDIVNTLGKQGLVPIWGFLGNDPVVLRAFWSLSKHLKVDETAAPKRLLYGIALIVSVKVGCPRCMNTHERELIQNAKLSPEFVDKVRRYEESYRSGQLERDFYLALKFGETVSLGGEITDSFWKELNQTFTQKQLFEMVIIAFLEYCLARYGNTLASFDESIDWPHEHTPSEKYRSVITGKEITLFTQTGCVDCKRAKMFFDQHEIRFIEKDVSVNPEFMKELERLGSRTLATVLIGKIVFSGFYENIDRIKSVLGIK
jgi:glutaredoxin